MLKQFLECGTLTGTHGIRGELKLMPETDSPRFLLGFHTLYIDGKPMGVDSARVHKNFVIIHFTGIDSIEEAQQLKGRVVCFHRDDAHLEPGAFFLQDLIGLEATDCKTGASLGTICDVLYLPAGNVYVIKGPREILVPARREFINPDEIVGTSVPVRLLEGM